MNAIRAPTLRSGRITLAVACALLALPAAADEPLVMQLHWANIAGVRQIESGHYELGVERLEARLPRATLPSLRAPILIDLCVGYTMLNRLEQAAAACDAAVDIGRYRQIAYNNRGVLNMVRGRLEAAIEDFHAANHVGVGRVARTNQRVATQRFAAITRQREQAAFARNMDVVDVSTATLREMAR